MWFRTTGIQLLGVVALAVFAAAQTAPAPSAITRTVVAATKLPTVTDVPLHFRAVGITLTSGEQSSAMTALRAAVDRARSAGLINSWGISSQGPADVSDGS